MKKRFKFTIILFFLGFLVAIQFNSIKKPKERDTLDLWAIRNELAAERKLHSELLSEIREIDETIYTYESSEEANARQALTATVDKLYELAGMTDLEGPGVVIEIRPSPESIAYGMPIYDVSPDLLTRFVNELNRFKTEALEIDGKRITTLSAIRDINGRTTVNGLNVSTPPFQIKVMTQTIEDGEKVYNSLLASSIQDAFYLDDLIMEIEKPNEKLKIQGWNEKFTNRYLNELLEGES